MDILFELIFLTCTVGITQYTQKGHIARATLEATCFQTKAILDAMENDSGHTLSELAVDGGMSNSDLAMQVCSPNHSFHPMRLTLMQEQIQANLISIPVYRPKMRETTALGAAIAAGLAIGVWRNFAELRDINRAGGAVFEPQVSRQESAAKFGEWEKAVQMSRGWVRSDNATEDDGINHQTHTTAKDNELSPPLGVHNPDHSFVSEVVKSFVPNKSTKRTTQISVKEIEVHSAPKPLVEIVRDLDDMDEEDLFLELRKVEILQRLKKLRKLDYY